MTLGYDPERELKAALEENDKLRAEDEIWQYQMRDKLPKRQQQPTPQRQSALTDAEIARLIDAKVMQALMAFKKKITEAVAGALAHERAAVRERIAEAMSAVKFPVAKSWRHGCLYEEGSVVIFCGSTFQAVTDTSRSPGHPDWQVLACCGNDGQDGRDLRDSSSVTDFRKRSKAS
jgi:hypothetical protein